jgi:hypothetical protein
VCIGKLDQAKNFVPAKRLAPEQAAVRDPELKAQAVIIEPSLIFCLEL